MKQYRFFLLSIVIIAVDQISKALVVRYIPVHSVAWTLWGDFFQLTHIRNLGVIFGMGSGLPGVLRVLVFIIIPSVFLVLIGIYTVRGRDITISQQWILAALLGGGLGNQIDRIIRSEGVVDFLDFKFYGIFGWERWPIFNVADSSLVVSAILLILISLKQTFKARNHE